MTLMNCPECQGQVSDRAESCPRCGCPLAGRPDLVGGRRVRTIEQTAKRFKATILLGGLAVVIGLALCLPSFILSETTTAGSIGQWLMILGLPVYVIGKTLAWWHHG